MSVTAADIDARVQSCQGLVRSLAQSIYRKFHGAVDLQDLVGYGQLGLAQAAREFDASRNVQFSTYAYYRIRGTIYDGAGKMAGRTYAARCDARFNDVLEDDAASSDDAAQSTAGWLNAISEKLATSAVLERTFAPGADVPDNSATLPLSTICSQELRTRLHQLIEELPHDAATLIRATYFSGLSLQDAATQLGISKSWASRLHAKTLKLLADRLRAGGYADDAA